MNVATEILQGVKEAGLKYKFVAERAGVSVRFANTLARGGSGASDVTLDKLRDAILELAEEIEEFDPELDDPREFQKSIGLNLSSIARRHGSTRNNIYEIFMSGIKTQASQVAMRKALREVAKELRQLTR